jgi:hypothetical protein
MQSLLVGKSTGKHGNAGDLGNDCGAAQFETLGRLKLRNRNQPMGGDAHLVGPLDKKN